MRHREIYIVHIACYLSESHGITTDLNHTLQTLNFSMEISINFVRYIYILMNYAKLSQDILMILFCLAVKKRTPSLTSLIRFTY